VAVGLPKGEAAVVLEQKQNARRWAAVAAELSAPSAATIRFLHQKKVAAVVPAA
jgi:hypothetical protein